MDARDETTEQGGSEDETPEKPSGATQAPPSVGFWGPLFGLLAAALLFVPYRSSSDAPIDASEQAPTSGETSTRTLRFVGPDATPALAESVRLIFADAPPQSFSVARADSFELPSNLPPAVEVVVEGAGFAHFRGPMPEGDSPELHLSAPVAFAGRLRGPQGQPEANAELSLWLHGRSPEDGPADLAGVSGDDGTFGFPNAAPGAWHLEARSSRHGFGPVTAGATESPEASIDLEFQETGAISGQVHDARGRPLEGAEVRLVGSGVWPAESRITDEHGRFAWQHIPPGVYELRAARNDDVAVPQTGLVLLPRRNLYRVLRLSPGQPLVGTVRGPTGPIEGATVHLAEQGLSMFPQQCATDAAGRFQFSSLARGVAVLRAEAPGFVPAVTAVFDGAPATIELQPAASIALRVLDDREQPLEGARVYWLNDATEPSIAGLEAAPGSGVGALGVVPGPVPPIPLVAASPDAPTLMDQGHRGTTGADGTLLLEGLPPSTGQLYIEAPAGGLMATILPRRRLRAGQELAIGDVPLHRGATLEGRLTDARDYPLGGVLLEVQCEGEPWPRHGITEADGTFRFEGLQGTVSVVARPTDLPAVRGEVGTTPEATATLLLQVPSELHRFEGRLFDHQGFPVQGASIVLEGPQEALLSRRTLSARDGTFQLSALPPPPWNLEVDHPGAAMFRRSFEEAPEAEVQLSLEAGFSLRGKVTDAQGNPIAATLVLVQEEQRRQLRAFGAFEEHRIPAGQWQLRIQAEGHLPETRTIELSEDTVMGDIALAAAGELVGQVVDRLGTPISGAVVGAEGIELATETDAEGNFALLGIPSGWLHLTVRHRAGTHRSERLRIVAAERRTLPRIRLDGIAEAPQDPSTEDPTATEAPSSAADPARAIEVRRQGSAIVITAIHGVRGLSRGDIVEAINGEPVFAAGQARSMLQAGSRVRLQLRRGSRSFERTLVLPAGD